MSDGTHPTFLEADPRSGDLLWKNQVTARPELIAILDCMTRYQSSNRYTSAREVRQDLAKLHARDSQASRSEDSPIEALKKEPIAPNPAQTQITQPEPLKKLRAKPWTIAATTAIHDQIRSALASPQFQVAGSVGPIRFTETGDPQEAIQLVTLRSNPRTNQPEFSPQMTPLPKPQLAKKYTKICNIL